MALQTLNGPVAWPYTNRANTVAPALATLATIASGNYAAVVIQARENMTITHGAFKCGAVVASGACDFRIETVDATNGQPSGTLWNSGTTNDSNFTIAPTQNTFTTVTALTGSASITKGDWFAVKLAYSSGTSFVLQSTGFEMRFARPYMVLNTGSPTNTILTQSVGIALGSSSTAFYCIPGLMPATSLTQNAFNNTNSAKRGLKFQVPFTCRVVGLRWWAHGSTSSGGLNIRIEDSGGTEVSSSSTAIDGDIQLLANTGMNEAYFDNAVTLSPATDYYAVLEPEALAIAGLRSAFPHGTNCCYSTWSTAAGSVWVDDTSALPLIDLLIDQLDDGVQVGGASTGFMIG
jgi:hypothetical protein